MTSQLKLTYFDLSGKAEAIRLAFAIGDVKFQDERLAKEQFAELKSSGKLPMGALPVLEIDGKTVCQSDAIFNYAAKLAALHPSDPFEAMKVEEVRGCTADISQTLASTFAIQDLDEKIAKRKELLAGATGAKIAALEKLLHNNGGKLAISDQLTAADVDLYAWTSFLTSGFFDGVPADLFASYPKIQASVKAVAEHPKVVKWYEDRKSEAN